MSEIKKLYRSENNKVISGVIGGLGEYFEIDPTILRLAFIIITILSGIVPAVIAYIIAILIVPKKYRREEPKATEVKNEPVKEPASSADKEKKEEENKTEKLDL